MHKLWETLWREKFFCHAIRP
ncbi:hypothetical protein PLANTIT3_30172 [Plantibacter sp. T3]|nr:hypothetical protein PLANTIT3_30172 [Plantibacter sp. T3]